MRISIELRSFMSRAETFRALTIVQDAAARLAHRMTETDLDRLGWFAEALARTAQAERERRCPSPVVAPFVQFAAVEDCTPCTEGT